MQENPHEALRLLKAGDAPRMSALGCLVASLSMRRVNKQIPFTVLSCDNLQGTAI